MRSCGPLDGCTEIRQNGRRVFPFSLRTAFRPQNHSHQHPQSAETMALIECNSAAYSTRYVLMCSALNIVVVETSP